MRIITNYNYARLRQGELQPHSAKCIQNTYELNSLPPFLFDTIECYDVMRALRTEHSDQFTPEVIGTVLAHGTKREPNITEEDLHAHRANPEKRYDFKGRDFKERYVSWHCFSEVRTFFIKEKNEKEEKRGDEITAIVFDYLGLTEQSIFKFPRP